MHSVASTQNGDNAKTSTPRSHASVNRDGKRRRIGARTKNVASSSPPNAALQTQHAEASNSHAFAEGDVAKDDSAHRGTRLSASRIMMDHVMNRIANSKHIVVIVGAGLSVSCGIPDFRSASGLYSTLQSLNLPVAEPEDLLDIATFDDTPELFYSFASRIWPRDSIKPSLGHKFLSLLYAKRKLLRVYTQNVDGLETVAGVPRAKVIECHGTMLTAKCRWCI